MSLPENTEFLLSNQDQEKLQADLPYNEESSNGYKVRTAKDALRPRPPLEWLVNSVISEASLNFLVGEPGSKKTYAALDMAICVALGIDWLEFQTTQGTVLIIDEDNGEYQISKRIGSIIRAHGRYPLRGIGGFLFAENQL